MWKKHCCSDRPCLKSWPGPWRVHQRQILTAAGSQGGPGILALQVWSNGDDPSQWVELDKQGVLVARADLSFAYIFSEGPPQDLLFLIRGSLINIVQGKEVYAATALAMHLTFHSPMTPATLPAVVIIFDPSLLLGRAKYFEISKVIQWMFIVITERFLLTLAISFSLLKLLLNGVLSSSTWRVIL